jgi:hypothetical protein
VLIFLAGSCRHNETFVPVCLPNFQPNAFVHAYVNCLDEAGQQQQQQQDTAASIQQQLQHADPSQQQQHQHGAGSRGEGTFLLLLSGSADAFHRLSAAQHSFVAAVTAGPGGGVLGRVQAAAVQPGQGRVRVEALPAPLGEHTLHQCSSGGCKPPACDMAFQHVLVLASPLW